MPESLETAALYLIQRDSQTESVMYHRIHSEMFNIRLRFLLGLPGGLKVKSLPAMQETQVQSLGRDNLLEQKMATHSSILAWRIPWTANLAGLSL